MNILDFSDSDLMLVLSYLTYDEVAKTRVVCRKFNAVNQQILNHGFFKLLNDHQKRMKQIKSQLPRRESERRSHPLAKHSDVLTCIETRLSMLSMTYSKHVQNGSACFIPGKIIDECYRIMRLINGTEIRTLRAHEILQELRDISSMAIEHFDEKIAPDIRKVSPRDSLPCAVFDIFPRASLDGILSLSRNSSCSTISAQSTPFKMARPRVQKKSKLSSLVRLYKKQSKVIKSQSKQIMRMIRGMKEQKQSINSLKRRLDESEAKNLELSNAVKKFKEKPSSSKIRKE